MLCTVLSQAKDSSPKTTDAAQDPYAKDRLQSWVLLKTCRNLHP